MRTIILLAAMALLLSGCDVIRYAAKCTTIAQTNCN